MVCHPHLLSVLAHLGVQDKGGVHLQARHLPQHNHRVWCVRQRRCYVGHRLCTLLAGEDNLGWYCYAAVHGGC